MSNQTRSDFLKILALSTIFFGSGFAFAVGCEVIRQRGKTKNIIFLVSYGVIVGSITIADFIVF
jgi:hypothetical protein